MGMSYITPINGGGGGGGSGGFDYIQSGVARHRVYFAGYPSAGGIIGVVASINDSVYAMPFTPQIDLTIDNLVIEMRGMGGVLFAARMGVYNNISDTTSPSNLYPGTLLVSADIANNIAIQQLPVNLTMTAGKIYWISFFTNDNTALYTSCNVAEYKPILGAGITTFAPTQGIGYRAPLAFGVMPLNYPAGGVIIDSTTDVEIPVFGLHRA